MLIDSRGNAHVAAQLGNDLYYVTNSGGRWTREQLSSAPRNGEHTDPSITLDASGALWIAFSDRCRNCAPNFSAGVYYVSQQGRAWSEPVQVPDYAGEHPLIAVHDGSIHVADTDINSTGPVDNLDDIFRPIYVTNADGDWSLTEVGRQGTRLAFHLSGQGDRSIIYNGPGGRRSIGDSVYHAVAGPGATEFTVRPLVEDGGCYASAAFATDGRAAAFWEEPLPGKHDFRCAETGSTVYVRLDGGRWSLPRAAPMTPDQLALDASGAVHAVAWTFSDLSAAALTYFTDRSGDFTIHRLADYQTDEVDVDMAIATDAVGRAHIFFSSNEGTFYAISPAP